jgi:hypothetical protein
MIDLCGTEQVEISTQLNSDDYFELGDQVESTG